MFPGECQRGSEWRTLSSCKKQDVKLTFEFPESWGGMSGRGQQVSLSGSKMHNLGLQVSIRLFLLSIHSLKKDFPQQRNTLSAQSRFPSFYILSLKVKPSFTTHGHVGVKNKVCNVGDIRLGFHLPPFSPVPCRHLHVLAPASKMNLKLQLCYSFIGLLQFHSWRLKTAERGHKRY